MKKALIICTGNTAAVSSMVMNLSSNGFDRTDVADFSGLSSVLKGSNGIGELRQLNKESVIEDLLRGGVNDAIGLLTDTFANLLDTEYDLTVNIGLSRTAAGFNAMIKSSHKIGLCKKNSGIEYSGSCYFPLLISKSVTYLSGAYNDISFYNSLLIGHVEKVFDYEPVFPAVYIQGSGVLIIPKNGVNGFITADNAHHTAALFDKAHILCKIIHEGQNVSELISELKPLCVITDSSHTASISAALGAKVVYAALKQQYCGLGPLSERCVTIIGISGPKNLFDNAMKLNDISEPVNENGFYSKIWRAAENPFSLMEKDINSYFSGYGRHANIEKIFSDAEKSNSPIANKLQFYKYISGINVLSEEKKQAG